MLATESMTQLPQVLVNVRVSRQIPDIAELLAAEIDEAGRALGGTGRILVRTSGTEPLVRVMVEAPTEALARSPRTASPVSSNLATDRQRWLSLPPSRRPAVPPSRRPAIPHDQR